MKGRREDKRRVEGEREDRRGEARSRKERREKRKRDSARHGPSQCDPAMQQNMSRAGSNPI